MAASVSPGSPAATTDPRELRLRDLVSRGDADTLVAEVARLVDTEATKAVATASHFKKPDPPKPEQFYGDSRRSPSIQSWQHQVISYFSHWPHLPAEDKVLYAAGYLKGSALLWWQHLGVTHGDPVPLKTLDAFLEALRAAFLPPNSVDRARHDLACLKQTGSVRQYLDTFMAVCFRIPADQLLDAEKKQRFLDGLKPYVRREVLLKFPGTFAQAAELADQYDRVAFDYRLFSTAKPSRPPGHRPNSSVPFAAGNGGPAPMELGTIQVSQRRESSERKPLSAAEKQFLAKNDGCFYCRKPHAGHRARNCPLKRRQQGNGKAQ